MIEHRARTRGGSHLSQSDTQIEVQHFVAAECDDVLSAARFDPSKGGIHQKRGQRSTALLGNDGQQPDLEQPVVARDRQRLWGEILVDRVARAWRSDADEPGDVTANGCGDVDIALVELVGERAVGTLGVLSKLAGIDIVSQLVDARSLCRSGDPDVHAGWAAVRPSDSGCRHHWTPWT